MVSGPNRHTSAEASKRPDNRAKSLRNGLFSGHFSLTHGSPRL